MLILQIPRALNHQTTWDVNVLRETSPCKSKHVNPLISTHGFSSLHCGPNKGARSCPFSLNKLKPLFLSQNSTSRTWLVSVTFYRAPFSFFLSFSLALSSIVIWCYLDSEVLLQLLQCHSQDAISPENEYRSSRNIAISLFKRYKYYAERGGGDNLKVYSVILTLVWGHLVVFQICC